MITRLFTSTCTVEPYQGVSGPGTDVYGEPVVMRCTVDQTRRLVTNGQGDEVVSESTLFCDASQLAEVPAGSRVTVNDNSSFVITVRRRDNLGSSRVRHLEILLT